MGGIMKILKILKGNDDGGVFTCEKQYILSLKKRGIEVYGVIIGQGNSYETYKDILGKYIELPEFNASFSGSLKNIYSNIRSAYKYGRKYGERVFDEFSNSKFEAIIYRRSSFLFLVGILGKKFDKKVFWHMPNIASSKSSKIFYNIFLRLFSISPIANSKFTRASLGTFCKHVVYPGYSPERVSNGVPKYRDSLNISDSAPLFGVAARISKDKAQDIVVRAFVESAAFKNGAHLILAGGYDDEDFFANVKDAAGDNWDKSIHHLGKISDLNNFYASIDVMVNGRINAEPFGISIAESLGAGVPVIAYNLGGPQEMIEEGRTGWLTQQPTVQQYKEAFNRCYKEKGRWKKMRVFCIEKAESYTVERNVTNLIDILSY